MAGDGYDRDEPEPTATERHAWLLGLAAELRAKADRQAEESRRAGLDELRAALRDAVAEAGEGGGATDGPPRPPVGPGADEPAGTGETGGG